MSSRLHPKNAGDAVEAAVIDATPGFESVTDGDDRRFDARVSSTGRPVEIKAALPEVSNGGDQSVPGRWYVKRSAHEALVEDDGLYSLHVYKPVDGLPIIASRTVSARRVSIHLDGSWYDVDGDRSEQEVAKLSWPTIISREAVTRD
jgi:hypothetical protein